MDEHIAGIIVAYLGGPYCARALRATSRVWRELIQRPKKCSPNVLACEAARIGNLELCKFACSRGVSRLAPVASIAAKKGYRAICEFVKAKDGFVDSFIVRKASRRGHFDLCASFGMTMFAHTRDVAIALGAARVGDKKRMSATILGDNLPWLRILKEAARGGQREILDLVMPHATSRNALCDALYSAARGGHREICDVLLSKIRSTLSEYELNNMLIRAARGGHREICELARELGARNYAQMMYGAARNNRIKICMLAREWLVKSETHESIQRIAVCTSMRIAADHGHDELCMLLCDWGATSCIKGDNY